MFMNALLIKRRNLARTLSESDHLIAFDRNKPYYLFINTNSSNESLSDNFANLSTSLNNASALTILPDYKQAMSALNVKHTNGTYFDKSLTCKCNLANPVSRLMSSGNDCKHFSIRDIAAG